MFLFLSFRYKDFLKLHSKITVSHKSQALRGRSVNASSKVSAQNLSPIDESKVLILFSFNFQDKKIKDDL